MSCSEFPGARSACRGLIKPLQITLDVGVRLNRTGCTEEGLRSGITKLCARKTVIPWMIICVYNVGMIRVHRLKCDSLEMFSVHKCVMYHEWTFRSA